MAQSVMFPTWGEVMISWLMNLSPTVGSVLIAQSLEPASDSVSVSLSLKNKHLKKIFKDRKSVV